MSRHYESESSEDDYSEDDYSATSSEEERDRSPSPVRKAPSAKRPREKKQAPAPAPKAPAAVKPAKRVYAPRYKAHCNACKESVNVKQGEKITQANGAFRIKGICGKCGKGINAFPKINK